MLQAKYEKEISQLRAQVADLQKSQSESVSIKQYNRDIAQLRANLGKSGPGDSQGESRQLQSRMSALQETVNQLQRKTQSLDTTIKDLNAGVSGKNKYSININCLTTNGVIINLIKSRVQKERV